MSHLAGAYAGKCYRCSVQAYKTKCTLEIQLENRSFVTLAAPALRSPLYYPQNPTSVQGPKCLNNLCECQREDCRTNRRKDKANEAFYAWQTALTVLSSTNAYASGHTTARAQKIPVHAVPILYKPFALIQHYCSASLANALCVRAISKCSENSLEWVTELRGLAVDLEK